MLVFFWCYWNATEEGAAAIARRSASNILPNPVCFFGDPTLLSPFLPNAQIRTLPVDVLPTETTYTWKWRWHERWQP